MRSKIKLLGAILIVIAIAILGTRLVGVGATENSINPRTTTTQVINTHDWVNVFSDDFNGNKLDANKWVTCYDWRQPSESGCTNSGNFEQEWYMPQQVTVQNGSAVLTAINDPITVTTNSGPKTYLYRSGMISTGRPNAQGQVKWSATYGYYEARLKFDGGQGVWPAFWLLPTDQSWPPEIDAMEFLGNDPTHVLLTSHWKNASGQPQKDSSIIQGPDYTAGWHTYAVNWQPNSITWYVDGMLQKTVTGIEVPNKPMEIILNLAIGGTLPGNANATTPFPRSLQIDYVRVYELKK